MQFFFVGYAKLLGIRCHRLQTDEDVARDIFRAFLGGIEGENIGVVVVIEEEFICLQYAGIIGKLVGKFTQCFPHFICHLPYPASNDLSP